MEVIINKGTDSIRLSKEGIDELIKLGWTYKEERIIHKNKDKETDIMYSPDKEYYNINFFKHRIDSNEFRSNKDIVKVFYKLGNKACKYPYCDIKIVNIPDDIKWYIEYDNETGGYEIIHEEHRTWE